MGTQLTELIEKAVNCLEMIGLNPQTIVDYQYSAFEPIAKRLLLLTNIEAKDIQIQEAFFTMQYQNEIISRQTYNWRIRGIRILCEVLETGTFSWKVFSKNEKIILPDRFEAALSSYLEEQTCCDKRKSSIESICRRFLQSVSTCTESITEIKAIHIRDFIVHISETRSKSIDSLFFFSIICFPSCLMQPPEPFRRFPFFLAEDPGKVSSVQVSHILGNDGDRLDGIDQLPFGFL